MHLSARHHQLLVDLSTSSATHLEGLLRSWGGRKAGRGVFTFPLTADFLDRLCPLASSISSEVLERWELPLTFPLRHIGQDDHPLWPRLMKHQRDAVDFLVSTPHRGSLLALAPGLGKTLVAWVAGDLLDLRPILIVTTPTLLRTWERERLRWFPDAPPPEVCRGCSPSLRSESVITTYETLVTSPRGGTWQIRPGYSRDWGLVIVDESIMVKNRSSRRRQAVGQVTSRASRVWLLSGAPVSRFYDDLFSQLSLLLPDVFTSYWRFVNETCIVQETVWGTSIIGNRPDIDLSHRYRDLMFIRNQEDVVDLPEMLFETRHLQLTPQQARAYDEMMTEFETTVDDQLIRATSRMAQISRGLQIVSCLPNGDSCKLDAVEELLDEGYPLPMIVWVHFKHTGESLYRRLSRRKGLSVRLVTGDTEGRDEAIVDYLNGRVDVLILSLGVGKFGLTLTNTRTVVYVDKGFNFDDYQQSLFRVKRIGLTHSPVVVSLHVPGTIDDELVVNNLITKSYAALTGNLRDLLRGLGCTWELTPG